LKTVAQRNRRKSIAESKAAQKRAAELMGQGVSADHIAKALNVSTVTVYQYLKKHKQDLMQDSSDLPNNNEETE
jgi:transposase